MSFLPAFELHGHPSGSAGSVFVLHGIRDRGHWTKKIAARIKTQARKKGPKFVSRTPGYGYFSILSFVLPWYRRYKVEWLMDLYVEAKAAYPEAKFHFMGHSNGTYLCARALLDYPAVSFRRIMFAGSVVRPDYPWSRLIHEEKRVDKVYNAIATKDSIVALFPNGLRWFKGFFDLGGAGHRGFDTEDRAVFQLDYDTRGNPRRFVKGGHSAGRQESQWDEIADFVVNGTNPGEENVDFAERQPLGSRLLGGAAPVILLSVVAVLLTLLAAIMLPIASSTGTVDLVSPVASAVVAGPDWANDAWAKWSARPLSFHVFALVLYVAVLRFLFIKF